MFEAIKFNDYNSYRLACKLGHLEVVEAIIEEVENTGGRHQLFLFEMNRSLDYQGFRYAVLNRK